MFSGKTTELLRRFRAAPAGLAMAFKHRIDNRYRADCIVSHDMDSVPAVVVGTAAEIAEWVWSRPTRGSDATAMGCPRFVAVDEAHFFDEGLARVCWALVGSGIDVVMTALDRDSWGRPFSVVESIRSPTAKAMGHPVVTWVRYGVCARCGAVADRTQRLTPIVNGWMIGGPESYEPRCAGCWRPPPGSTNAECRMQNEE